MRLSRGKPKKKIAPGVTLLEDGRINIRARREHPRTGQFVVLDRILPRGTLKADAMIARQRWIERLGEEEDKSQQRVSVRDFATSWLRGRWPNLAPSTRERYTNELDLYVFTHEISDLFIDAVTVADVQDWKDSMASKGLRAATINGPLRLLRQIFKAALPVHGLRYNPADKDYVPAVATTDTLITEKDPNSLTPEDAAKLLRAIREKYPQHEALVALMLTTTLRLGEARALQWQDVDFEARVIRVRRRFSGVQDQLLEGTKGKGRSKTVPLHPEVARLLDVDRGIGGWIFRSATGAHLRREVLRKPLEGAAKAAGLGRITAHGLRRTGNNCLRVVGDAVVVRSITGHVTERMTEHYSTVRADEKAAVSQRAFASIFGGEGGSEGGARSA